ncbi:ketoacyl-ACP synthase III [Stieleria mannarensis]|uniref:ketoacyl-ACP synthase III n=1 Tax=Stieleria mannarensis TaxID=2755585 RepID=UPI0015FFA5AC
MPHAQIGPIAVHFPDKVETNAELQQEFPRWDLALIEEKTGIRQRYIAAEGETASDLAVAASEKLFAEHQIDPGSIDFLLFCTQTPDYPLPTTSCLIQDRLGLPTHCGALDFNLGCSGFVYGLAVADGLIQSGVAKRILFLTAETYTKYIDRADRSLRTIFSDGAAATLLTAGDQPSLRGFKFGSDGSGADMLIVGDGGARAAEDAIEPRHRKRWKSRLYMDGPSLINFTVDAVPELIDQILQQEQMTDAEISQYLMHQATWKMLDELRLRLGLAEERLPIELAEIGNTVSCTLPILIDQLRKSGRLDRESVNMLIGFGVGLSWAGCLWQDLTGGTAS